MDENKVFDEEIDEGEDLVLTLEMEDGTTEDCIVLTIFPMDDKQYIALLPVAQADDEDADVYLYGYNEVSEEEFELIGKYMENGITYNALVPADESKQNGEYVIFRRIEDENGDVYLETIEDDDEFDRIADIFDDSFNDLDMILASKAGFLFRSTEAIKAAHPELPAFEDFDEFLAAIKEVL